MIEEAILKEFEAILGAIGVQHPGQPEADPIEASCPASVSSRLRPQLAPTACLGDPPEIVQVLELGRGNPSVYSISYQ